MTFPWKGTLALGLATLAAVVIRTFWSPARKPHATAASAEDSDRVDEAGRESFPASDPPAWYAGK